MAMTGDAAAGGILDDAAAMARIDPAGMLAAVGTIPGQVREAWAISRPLQVPAGHAGAREGGHFHVAVVSERFTGLQRVARHRLVYHLLSDLMQRGIHALAIDARAPGEA